MSTPIFEGTTPLISDRYIITLTAGQDLSVGDLVEISSAWTAVKTTSANSKKIVGVCLTNAKSGQKVSIVCRGIVRVKAAGTIAAGDQVTSSTTAGAVKADNASLNTTVIGIALEAMTTGGTGCILLW